LEYPSNEKEGEIRRKATSKEGNGTADKPPEQNASVPKHIGESTATKQKASVRKDIAHDNPLNLRDPDLKSGGNSRKCDIDGRIKRRQQSAQAGENDRRPRGSGERGMLRTPASRLDRGLNMLGSGFGFVHGGLTMESDADR
jgi:hypothetical protein